MTLLDKAELFHSLHRGSVLVLPNAWDVASARIVEEAGASAVATTSAGVAWSLGTADGHRIARDVAIDLTARVAAAVGVPVTADIENGFASSPDGVAETIGMVVEAGAVGINIEDGSGADLLTVDEFVERVAAARAAASIPLYINARTDVYLRGIGEPHARLKHAIERAHAYLEAGASGVFVPGVVDPGVLSVLAKEINGPLNALAGPGAPPIAELAAAGVARVSLGSSVAQAAYGLVRRAATEALTSGTYTAIADPLTYPELQKLFP
jgi:2-methylisocitrate lyase-like PEP mutase family enzyme